MKLRKPQVQLRRKKNEDGNWHYYLHAVTFFNRTGLVADGHYPIEQELNDKGMFIIRLKTKRDHSIEKMNYITPVVHTIDIGVSPFGSGEGMFCILNYGPGDKKGTGDPDETAVPTTGSDED